MELEIRGGNRGSFPESLTSAAGSIYWLSGQFVGLWEATSFFLTAHACNLTFEADSQGTVPGARASRGGEVDSYGDDIPVELSMPVNPAAVRLTGLR